MIQKLSILRSVAKKQLSICSNYSCLQHIERYYYQKLDYLKGYFVNNELRKYDYEDLMF